MKVRGQKPRSEGRVKFRVTWGLREPSAALQTFRKQREEEGGRSAGRAGGRRWVRSKTSDMHVPSGVFPLVQRWEPPQLQQRTIGDTKQGLSVQWDMTQP